MALSPIVRARFDASADLLGIGAPPVRLRLKIIAGPLATSLFVQPATPCLPGAIVDWLAPLSPLRIEFGSRNVLRADLHPAPAAWERAFHGIDVDMILIDPSGSATITVRGRRAQIAGFSRRITARDDAALDVRSVTGGSPAMRLLTDPQDQALRVAVQAGYYLIPRPLNLKQLARRLDISSASLSERLRRAEARVLSRYVNEGGTSPWDDRTLFDASAPHPDSADWPDPEIIEVQGSGSS